MVVHLGILAFVLASIAIYIAVAYMTRTGIIEEFYVAGRRIPPVVSGAATAAAWMSAASFISMAGVIALAGYDAAPFLIGWTGGYTALALLIAPYLRKYGKYTIAEFLEDRYYSPSARVLGVIIILVVSFTYLLGQMIGIGIALSLTLGVPVIIGIWLTTIVILIYTVIGGMKSVTYVEVAQYTILITAYLLALWAAWTKLLGFGFPHLQVGGLLQKLISMEKAAGASATYVDPFTKTVAGGHGPLNWWFTALVLMLGTVGLPHIMTKYYLVPSARDARFAVGWALVFIALLYCSASVYATVARYLLMQLSGMPIAQAKQIGWVKALEAAGLVKLQDLNGNGILDGVIGAIGKAEIGVKKDVVVMGMPMVAELSWPIVAYVITGGLAAALSTSGALLITMTIALTRDLYKRFINPQATEKREVAIARIATVALAVVGAALASALFQKGGVIAVIVGWAFALVTATFFPAFTLGMWTRVGRKAIMSGMVAGLIVCYSYILAVFFGVIEPIAGLGQIAGGGIFGLIANLVVAGVVQAATQETPPKHVLELLEYLKLPEAPRR